MPGSQQHVLPQFYLRPFLEPSGLVYTKWAARAKPVRSPRNVAREFGYYGLPDQGKTTLDDVNDHIENIAAPAIRRLLSSPESVVDTDFVVIRWFVANLAVRTPAFVHKMANAYRTLGNQVSARVAGVAPSERRASEIEIRSGPHTTLMSTEEFLGDIEELRAAERVTPSMVGAYLAIPDIAEVAKSMTIYVYEAPKGSSFLTSDLPVLARRASTSAPGVGGWSANDAFASLAIAPSHLMMLIRNELIPHQHLVGGLSVYDADAEFVEQANIETLRYAWKQVYSAVPNAEAQRWMRGIGMWQPVPRNLNTW